MTLYEHKLLKLSPYLGILALISWMPTGQTSNTSQIVSNGLQLNALTFNSQDLNTAVALVSRAKGTITNKQTEHHPDSLNRHRIQAILKHQTVDAISVENGQLTFQFSK